MDLVSAFGGRSGEAVARAQGRWATTSKAMRQIDPVMCRNFLHTFVLGASWAPAGAPKSWQTADLPWLFDEEALFQTPGDVFPWIGPTSVSGIAAASFDTAKIASAAPARIERDLNFDIQHTPLFRKIIARNDRQLWGQLLPRFDMIDKRDCCCREL